MSVWILLVILLLLLAASALLGWWLWRRRRRPASQPALATAWSECRAACGDARPWWLVLGPTGGGKSSLLGESGVAWNLRPAAGAAASAVPRPWRYEGGCLVELPGAWADAATHHPDWSGWLARLRRDRRRRPPAGVVACVPLSDLLRRGPQHLATVAAALRERCAELATAIGRSPPLYLVLTKADHVGGFKDFFAGLAEAERQQVLGVTLSWPPGEDPAGAWTAEHRELVQALRARRPLGLMRARDGEAARKLFQFPGQLDGLAQPVGELVAQLARPGRDACPLRGVYFASCHRAVPAAPPPTMRGERTDLERSVYLGHSRAAPSVGGTGHFSHALLARVLPEDRGLARPTGDRRRVHRRLRTVAVQVIPAVAAALGIWLLVTAWRGAALCGDVRSSLAEVRSIERLHPGDAPRNLDALDRFGGSLARLADADLGAARPALQAAAGVYARRLGDLCEDRAVRELGSEIATLRAAPHVDADRLYDAFRAYQMLAGAVVPDSEALERELTAGRRWFAGLEAAGTRLDWPTEVLARRQLERLGRELLPRGLAAAPGIDRQLVDATARDLGESLWIRQGWDEILRQAGGQFARPEARAAVGAVLPGPQPDGALTRRAWDDAVAALVDEKSAAIERTLQGLSIILDRDTIRRRLAERFRAEHRRAWLGVIAGASAVPAEEPAGVPSRIVDAAGPASAWPELVRRAMDELEPPSALVALIGTDRAPWARPALDPLLELRRDVDAFLGDARRGPDLDRVLALSRRFDEAAAASAARLSEVQPDDLRDALRSGIAGMVHGLWLAIDRATVRGLEQTWRSQVVPSWRRDCQGRFPFADAADEVPLVRFAAFANPRGGILAQGMAPIERLRAQPVAGRPALTLSRAYLDMAARAASMRAALFAGGGELVVAPCVMTLVQREGVVDIAVSIGAQQARLYDRPDARYELTVRQGEPGGAKIAIRVVTGEWKTRECAGRDWGWLRLLRSGAPHAAPDGGWLLTWAFDGSAAGAAVTWRAQARLEGRELGEAVAGDLLSAFAIPDDLVASEVRP